MSVSMQVLQQGILQVEQQLDLLEKNIPVITNTSVEIMVDHDEAYMAGIQAVGEHLSRIFQGLIYARGGIAIMREDGDPDDDAEQQEIIALEHIEKTKARLKSIVELF